MGDKIQVTSAAAHPTIRVDYRESRSIPSAAIQGILKPIGALILKAGDTQPAESPRISPPKRANKKCEVQESQIEDVWIYKLAMVEQERKRAEHKIYYFAGGGFRGPPSKEHWSLCAELANQLPEYEVNVVSYPLAPKNMAPISMPHLYRLCKALAAQARAENFRVTFIGDSSGGNIALILGLFCASEFLQEQERGIEGLCPVESIFAMCPATDLRNINPEIDDVDPHDPLLSREVITEVAEGWIGGWKPSDPRVSPILADLSLLRRANIKVDRMTAGYDVLSPDGILFRNELSDNGVQGDWMHWERQMHCFPLVWGYHIAEGVAGKDWIVGMLRKNARNAQPVGAQQEGAKDQNSHF